MLLKQLIPVIYTLSIKETIDFYLQKLQFNLVDHVPEWGWAKLSHGHIAIMITLPNKHVPYDKPMFTGSFYFETDGVDRVWNALKNNAVICYPIQNFEYGMREFAIYDNNGYLLQFGQQIEDAH